MTKNYMHITLIDYYLISENIFILSFPILFLPNCIKAPAWVKKNFGAFYLWIEFGQTSSNQ